MKITFLGSGAANSTEGKGKSKRLESSILIEDDLNILIDVTQFFSKQAKYLKNLSAVFITHGHFDACGGIKDFEIWLEKQKKHEIPLFAHTKTVNIIKKHFSPKSIKLIPIKDGQTLTFGGINVTPYEIPHALDSKFPMFAYKIQGKKSFVYASDMAKITPKFKKICDGAEILIVDGATYNRRIFTHLRIDEDLSKLCKLNVKKIILTQIGASVPKHEELEKIVKGICPKAMPAYDGLKISI